MNQTGQFGHEQQPPMPSSRDSSGQHQLNTTGYGYNQYQAVSPAANSVSVPSTPGSVSGPVNYNSEGDVPMEDADPYNRSKYPSRPSHHNRSASHYLAHEGSAAAQRYSPMNALNSNSAFPTSPKAQSQGQSLYAYQSQTPRSRQSPTRPSQFNPSQSYQDSPAAGRYNPDFASSQSGDFGESFYGQSPIDQQSGTWNTKSQMALRPQTNPPAPAGPGPVPRFHKVKSAQELKPRVNTQPPFRRANPEGGFISPLQALTTHLPSTYRICNPAFKYESSRNPRRVLTKPSKGVKNDGFDNDDSDYILYVNDILGSEDTGHKNRYLILDVLGQGTFGQVVKCQNLKTQEVVAVKVVKNRTAYFNQSMMEVSVLDLLNTKLDKNDDHHILRLKDTFIHRQHLCLVFELLSVNLYELIKQNQFRGLSTTLVRVFAQQLLNGLTLLNKARLIHCDLKPENILLKNLESPIIKIIDFGSACDERQTVYTYIQSRFYRSPEVLLGLPYSSAIDMWSLGCIVVELYLGLPLFPGSSEYNQVSRITEMLGLPPMWMLEMGKQSGEFFEKTNDEFGRRSYRLKSMDQYSREHNSKEQPSKKYFAATTLPEIIRNYSMPRKHMKQVEMDREMNNRVAFIDFVRGLLNINPLERWSPQQAKLHPFITQQKFTQPFVPPMNLKSPTTSKSTPPGVQQQQQAEAVSKQRAAQAAQAQAQAQSAAQSAYAIQMSQYQQQQQQQPQQPQQPQPQPQAQQPMAYNNAYGNPQQTTNAPPPYTTMSQQYGQQQQQQQQQQMGMMGQSAGQGQGQPQLQQGHYPPQQSLYAQATTRAGRQRANTLDQQQGGIPASMQRVASHLDPNAPIRLQPSPAYYPPPADGYADTPGSSQRRRAGQRNRDFIRTLEDGAMGDGFMNKTQWH